MAESDSRNTSGLFEIMRCARRRPSTELNMELLQGKQLPTVLGNRQILSPQTEGASDEKPKNPKWANIMVDTCSPSSTCEPEPSPVHTTASESSSTDEYRTQSLTKELRRPCFKKPSPEARIRQLNEELHEYCTLSFDEVDPFQQQGLTCRMLAFLKSLSRVLSWQDGDERGETPAYEMLDLSEVDLQMFKVVAQKADELIERHRFRQGELQWSPGEMRQEVTLELLPKQLSEAADQFQLVLEDPEGGAIFNPNQDGSEDRCVLTITILNENDELTRNIAAMKMSQFVDKVMNIDKLRLGAQSWYEDIISSVCDVTDDGERASCLDWMHHIFSMPWKFTLSVLIPPTAYCGGWLCFVMAIGAIGVLTCAICDFAELFGCVTSLEDSITAITIVALGTSMPDLFASQTAAVTDRYADASIVNVTGSNSVNVFLGIGLPWSIAAIYWSVAGPTQKWLDSYESHLGAWPKAAFIVQGGDLAFSVAVFNVAAGLALLIIHLRRSRLQGELGGPGGMKVLSGLLLISLWLFYLTLSIWKIKSNTTDIGTQIFAIFIGFCSLENLVLLFSCALLMRFGTAFFTGRPGQQADDEEAARLVADGREVASKGDLRHVARPGLSPVAPPAFTVKEVHGRPECYGRQNKSLDISFTSAAFVCFAAKRLQRAGRKVAESFRGLPPMPPPMFPPPSTLTLSPAGPQGGIERVPSFYSIDSEEGRDRQRRPSLTGRMAGLISGHAADWAALTVAGLAAGTLADPNGPRFLG